MTRILNLSVYEIVFIAFAALGFFYLLTEFPLSLMTFQYQEI